MSEWTQLAQPVRCIVELDKPLLTRRVHGALVQGDKNANAIVMEVYHTSGKPFDLTGYTVVLNFVRPDNLAVEPIAAETAGNIAVATLTDICYRVSGMYAASMSVQQGDVDRTVLRITGDVISTDNDGTVSDEKILPTPQELLQTLIQVEQARNNANAAAESANNAASRANQAASAIENASASAETLPTGQNATVSVEGMHFTFGLPRGEKGEKGDPGIIENVTITSINGLPEALANMDAVKLGGKAPEYYIQHKNEFDNSYFVNPVNQRGQTSYTGGYGIDRWQNSNSTITLTGDGLKLTKTDANAATNFIGTILPENINTNSVYTVAISINGVVETFNSAFPNTNGESYVIDGDTVSCEFGKAASCYVIRFVFGHSGEYIMKWAALYEGEYTADTLPPYVPKGYAAELAECQRYAYVIGEGNWLTGFHVIGHGLVVPLELPALRAHNTPSVECAAQAYIGTDGWVDITFRHLGYDYVTGVVHNIIFEPPAELQSGEVCIVSGIKGLFSDL